VIKARSVSARSPYRVQIPFLWDIEDRQPCGWVECFNELLEPTGWSYRESEAVRRERLAATSVTLRRTSE
jgi:hypothetical protein